MADGKFFGGIAGMRGTSEEDSELKDEAEDTSFLGFWREVSEHDHTPAFVILPVLFAIFALFQSGSILISAFFLNIALLVYAMGNPERYDPKTSKAALLVKVAVSLAMVAALLLKLDDSIVTGLLLFLFFAACALGAIRTYGPEEAAHPTLLRTSIGLMGILALLLFYFET